MRTFMLRYTTQNNNNTYSTRYYHYRSIKCALGALGPNPKRVKTHIKNTSVVLFEQYFLYRSVRLCYTIYKFW